MMRIPPRQRGFTLIELVVAMAIFAILSLAAWKVFDGLVKTRDRATLAANILSKQQAAYAQMLRDFSQAVPLSTRKDQQARAALLSDGQSVEFTRIGVIDPLLVGKSPMERVRYTLQDGSLWRLVYAQADDLSQQQPSKTRLLGAVESLQILTLDPAPSAIYPPIDNASSANSTSNANSSNPSAQAELLAKLPRGIEMQIQQKNQTLLWRFALTTALDKPANTVDGGANNSGNNSSNNNSNNNNNSNTANSGSAADPNLTPQGLAR